METNQEEYITEWELVHHVILAISNTYAELTNSVQSYSKYSFHYITHYQEDLALNSTQRLAKLLIILTNVEIHSGVKILHNFATDQKVPTDNAEKNNYKPGFN